MSPPDRLSCGTHAERSSYAQPVGEGPASHTQRSTTLLRASQRGIPANVTSDASAGVAWAIEQARAVGVPVPEILLLDTVHVDGS